MIFNLCSDHEYLARDDFYLPSPTVNGIGHFQSIKTDVLQIFSIITGDKTEFLSPMTFQTNT